MTGKQLCEYLSIDRRQLKCWLDEGLPCSGPPRRRSFEAAGVAAWLIAKGYAERAEPAVPVEPPQSPAPEAALPESPPTRLIQQTIVRTIGEVAQHCGVNLRTVGSWITAGMPGEPGSPGRRDGYFPLEEIEAWVAARRVSASTSADDPRIAEEARLKRARANIAELEYAERRSGLVDAAAAAREWIRAINEVKTQADQLPAWLAKKLPEGIDPVKRQELRRGLRRQLDEMYRRLQLALLKQADELEQSEPPTNEDTNGTNPIAENESRSRQATPPGGDPREVGSGEHPHLPARSIDSPAQGEE